MPCLGGILRQQPQIDEEAANVQARHQAAQTQAQKQSTITQHESLEVVRSLLRVSVFHVSYLRGLFPESSYKAVDMDNLEGMNIKMLLPQTPETKRMVDWVEKGVYDALKHKFLKTLIFGISNDPSGSSLLEEYKFSFQYDEAGNPSMEIIAKKKRVNMQKVATYESVKYQVIRLMRMLVQICQTLDVVPDERHVFMKLMYHDHAPDQYEPPCFKAAGDDAVGHFTRKPFSMTIGGVSTNHHNVQLKVLSLLDSVGMDDDDVGDKSVGIQNSTLHEASDITDDGSNRTTADGAATTRGDDMQCDDEEGVTTSQQDKYEDVKAFCLKRKQVDIMDIMAAFIEVQEHTLDVHLLPRLMSEGVLQRVKGDNDRFKVVREQPQAGAEAQRLHTASQPDMLPTQEDVPMGTQRIAPEASAAEAFKNLNVHTDGAIAVQNDSDRVKLGKRRADDSLEGKLAEDPIGTAKTTSGITKASTLRRSTRRAAAASRSQCPSTIIEPEPSEQQPEVYFESQQSQEPGAAAKRPRKMSFVQDSIHLVKRQRNNASQKARSQAMR